MTLPTDVAPGDPGHATLHNDVNAAVNALAVEATATLPTSTVVTGGTVARRGPVVSVILFADTTGGSYDEAVIPLGYRPVAEMVFAMGAGAEGNADGVGTLRIDLDGNASIVGPSSNDWTLTATYITDDAPPA